MYKLDLPQDRKEAAAIERRRNMEEQRKSRIFNARTRLIGVDEQTLNQQIKDNMQMQEWEKRRDEAYHNDAVRNDNIAQLMEIRQKEDEREMNAAINDFRRIHQQPVNRREWDLYDPEGLKKDAPARVSDDDPRCTVASLQKFEGEDLSKKAREKHMEEQKEKWLAAQMRERNSAEARRKEADRQHDLQRKLADQRALQLQEAEQQCRRQIHTSVAEYNKSLARELDARKELEKRQLKDDNDTEIANNIFGDFLTENPAQAQSALGSHRVVTDRWKGMSPEQIEEIKRQQKLQILEKEREKETEKRFAAEFEKQQAVFSKAGTLMEREKDRKERERLKKLASENKRMAMEQKSHQEYLEKQVYTNNPTASYFMQWNTTTR